MRKTIKTIAATFSAAILLGTGIAACGQESRSAIDRAKANGMTDAQALACEDLKNRHQTTSPEDAGARIETARTVNRWAPSAGADLRNAGNRLTYAANSGSTETWKAAVDNFADQCITLGWPTK